MGKQEKTLILGVLSFAVLLSVAGCASPPGPYEFSKQYIRLHRGVEQQPPPRFNASLPQIERGQSFWPTDKLGHYLISLPGKLLLGSMHQVPRSFHGRPAIWEIWSARDAQNHAFKIGTE